MPPPTLHRHFGLLHATALNITMIVGAGVFATIPLILAELPGPYALLGWVLAGALILVDGLIWSELAASFPGSGGSYLYLLECYGKERWGRLMAFLFIWQFLISGPLEIASGLIALAQFSTALSPEFGEFNGDWSFQLILFGLELPIFCDPSRLLAIAVGVLIIFLLYRRITALARLTMTFWLGVMGVIAWILIEGGLRFDPDRAFDFTGQASAFPSDITHQLGAAMTLALYSYFGYYNVCYIGDEVRDPARTIPRSILLSALVVCLLFVAIHLAILGTVTWQEAVQEKDNLPALFMNQIHGAWAATLITILLMWSCFGSVFAGLLGYSRIPYGAAKQGHFFSALARVHPQYCIPHVALLLVGGLTLFWCFFSLADVIDALVITRVLEQFAGQIIGLLLLRKYQPQRARPFKMILYPLPCLLALAGWLFVYFSAKIEFITLGLGTLLAGVMVFLLWTRHTDGWPFGRASRRKPDVDGKASVEA